MKSIEMTVHGQAEKEVCLDSREFFNFLHTEKGYRSYGDSELEVQNLCNMLNLNINIFSYTRCGSINPRWNRMFQPDPTVVQWSNFAFRNPQVAFLYHELDTHYELVIPRPAGVSAEVSEDISVDVSQDNEDNEMENLIPSMDFQPGVPSRGKPKKKRKGAPTFNIIEQHL